MTDIRQALEEAFKVIHPEPPCDWMTWDDARISEQRAEDQMAFTRWNDWRLITQARFRRFLDAEAWTDAALMLVPEGMMEWHAGKHFKGGGSAYMLDGKVLRDPIYVTAETPAHALLAACLKAKEQADG
ncbi:hypothetical protein [Novosphingobium sp. B1]|uniref:hypothetical protein n=1 Tax=Novosphingobium sp. B1 TaxID=1938756 RepID=UPI0009D7CABC|nr:hypothetical protein [Novosphingobium sp. B1]SMC45510.1 hypothetical protein SAMN06272759_1032 [Novosphingobium sp. B1]